MRAQGHVARLVRSYGLGQVSSVVLTHRSSLRRVGTAEETVPLCWSTALALLFMLVVHVLLAQRVTWHPAYPSLHPLPTVRGAASRTLENRVLC